MTLTLTQLAQFTLGAVLIVLLPGPNSLFVATTAAKVSRTAGWRAALGVFIGDGMLMVLAVLGAGTLLAGGSVFFRLMTLAGGAYLAWLGFGLIRQGIALRREARPSAAATGAEPTETTLTMHDARYSPFRRSLATSLLNPKAILFFAAFFVQFVHPDDPHLWSNFGVLAVIMQCISAAYLATVIAVSARLGHRASGRPGLVIGAHLVAGTAFCLFAIKLAFASF